MAVDASHFGVVCLLLFLSSVRESCGAHCQSTRPRDEELCCSVRRDENGYTESRFPCRQGCCGEELQQYCCGRDDMKVPLTIGLTLGAIALLAIVFAIVTCAIHSHGLRWRDVPRLCREGASAVPGRRQNRNQDWSFVARDPGAREPGASPGHAGSLGAGLDASPPGSSQATPPPPAPSSKEAPPSYDEIFGRK